MTTRRPASQVRSGLAAKALRNTGRPGAIKPKPIIKQATAYPKKPAQKRPTVHYQTKTTIKTPIHHLALRNAAVNKVKSTVASTQAPRPSTAPVAPPVPTVKINENGQLDLPYGDAFGSSMLDYQTQMNQDLLDLQQSQQAQAADYNQQKRDLTQQYDQAKRGTLNAAASRGQAFSSAYGTQVANNATSFNNANNDLDNANAQAQAGFSANRTGIETAFNNYLRRAVLDRGVELAGQAGTLGYGQAAAKPVYAPPKRPAPPKKPVAKKPAPKKTVKKKGK